MTDPMAIPDEMYELGLVPNCSGWIGKENKRRRCGIQVAAIGLNCNAHGGSVMLQQNSVLRVRKRLEDEILPQVTAKILRILNDEDTRDENIIKIWQTTMDRVGLAAASALTLEGNITMDAPLDILRRMLADNVVDGEVVEGPTISALTN